MNTTITEKTYRLALSAIQKRDWKSAILYSKELFELSPQKPEYNLILGLSYKNLNQLSNAKLYLSNCLEYDQGRFDAAIELSDVEFQMANHQNALDLLNDHLEKITGNPYYLNMAGLIFERLGLHKSALNCFENALELQPDSPQIIEHLAASKLNNGMIKEGTELLEKLLDRFPHHQRNHFKLSTATKARNFDHINKMKISAEKNKNHPERNIFINYAIGKELEDLEQWDDAFKYYKSAGDTAQKLSRYNTSVDHMLIQEIINQCDEKWLKKSGTLNESNIAATPIFIVGLPRTGTTLLERSLSQHSLIESAGESFFMQQALMKATNIPQLSEELIRSAAAASPKAIEDLYTTSINYRLSGSRFFIDKLPENYFFLGFIKKCMPYAKIIILNRAPMDACFAQYKQPYFRYAYNLENLAEYYLSYATLIRHWQEVLGDSLIEVSYEDLATNHKQTVTRVLDQLGVSIEEACFKPEKNTSPVNTASSVQVTEQVHSRSIGRWKKFRAQLAPLEKTLKAGGIKI